MAASNALTTLFGDTLLTKDGNRPTSEVLTGKITMPIGALLTSIFVGWIANKRLVDAENGLGGALHVFWRFLVCWLCPIALAAILLVGIFPSVIE